MKLELLAQAVITDESFHLFHSWVTAKIALPVIKDFLADRKLPLSETEQDIVNTALLISPVESWFL